MSDRPDPAPYPQQPDGGPVSPHAGSSAPSCGGPTPYGGPAQPYGGPWTPPAGGWPPGTIGYVETHFGRVAGFEKRFVAAILDTLLVVVPLLGIFVGFFMLALGSVADAQPGSGAEGGGLLLASGAFGVIALSYVASFGLALWNRVFRMGSRGQSLGKSQQDIMLIDAVTGAPIGPGRCFLRELLSGLVNQALYLSSLWMLWDDQRQTLHDKVMTSTVIELRR